MNVGIRINGDVPEFMSLYAGNDRYNIVRGSSDLYDGKGKDVCNPTGNVLHGYMAKYSGKSS